MKCIFCALPIILMSFSISAQETYEPYLGPQAEEDPDAQTFVIGERAYVSQEAYIEAGHRCATIDMEAALADAVDEEIEAWVKETGWSQDDRITRRFDVVFHIVRTNNGRRGQVTVNQMRRQVNILNAAFSGTGVSFNFKSHRAVNNTAWFNMFLGSSAERQAKRSLRTGNQRTLNFYTCQPGDGNLGWATFPSDYRRRPDMDGVVVDYRSMPGGTLAPYNLGDTGTHEVGHWVGLFHTFQGGCSNGDRVGDTPAHRVNFGCPGANTDTCRSQPGRDPVNNFMNYVDDACMDEFTPGQVRRFSQQIGRYR